MQHRLGVIPFALIPLLFVSVGSVHGQNVTANGTCAYNSDSGSNGWVISGLYAGQTYTVLKASDAQSFAGTAELEPTPQFACAGQILYVQFIEAASNTYSIWRIHFFGGVPPELLFKTGGTQRLVGTPESPLYRTTAFVRASQFVTNGQQVVMIDESIVNDFTPTSRAWKLNESDAPQQIFDFEGRPAITDACIGKDYDLRFMTNIGAQFSDIYTIADGKATRDQSSDAGVLVLSCGSDPTNGSTATPAIVASSESAADEAFHGPRPAPPVCHTLAPCHVSRCKYPGHCRASY